MNKTIATLVSLVMLCAASAMAATPLTHNLGQGKYRLAVGHVAIVVDANDGAKVVSFTHDGREALSQLHRPNAFGSTFWTSPQKEWNWPPVAEYDRLPYEVEDDGTSLTMTSQRSPRFGYRLRKVFAADPSDNAIAITYQIINESGATRQVAPWEITRVPADGIIFFDADADKVTPANTIRFANAFGAAWYVVDQADTNRKINADARGWLACQHDGLLLVKRFDDLTPSQPAPDEAEVQVYVNQGRTYIELESQGAYATLQPGETLSYTVRWYLAPVDGPAVASKKLLKAARKIQKLTRR